MDRLFRTLAEKVAPEHTALIIIDVQNDFCARGGFLSDLGRDMSMVQAMVPRLDSFISRARDAGAMIVFVRALTDDPYLSPEWAQKWTKSPSGKGLCLKGAWGTELYLLQPQAGDVVITKHRYSAFKGTDLDLVLRSKGIKTLLMSGVSTNVCVESTARDGHQMDYYIVFLEDCVANTDRQAHENTLENIRRYFGEVCSSADVLAAWGITAGPA